MAFELKPKSKLIETISLAVTKEQKERLYFFGQRLDQLKVDKTIGDLHRERLDQLLDDLEETLKELDFQAS